MRRLIWKLARRAYMLARGEPLTNLPDTSGEVYMQDRMALVLAGRTAPVVLDVGGNLGQWTLQFLDIARKTPGFDMDGLRYFVFEPVPATRERLTANIADAGWAHMAHVEPFALSDRVGTAHINILGAATSGRNSIVDGLLAAEADVERIAIETTTIDMICAREGIDRIDFVKIDAEGHDFAVISGAAELLAREAVDVIQFEYTKRWIDSRTFLKDVFATLEGTPYVLARIRPRGLEVFAAWHAEMERFFAANYAIVHPRALGHFAVRRGRFDASNTYA